MSVSGATPQAGGQGTGAQAAQGSQTSTEGQQQSLSDQILGPRPADQSQQGAGNQPGAGIKLDGMKEGETVEQYAARLNSEVTRARREAATYRTRLRSALGDDTPDDTGKTELQKLQDQVGTLSRDLEAERQARQTEKVQSSLISALASSGAVNPTRAMRLIDQAELEMDANGVPSKESIQAAVAALALEMPQIFSDVRGSGDGGAGNNGAGVESDFNAAIRRRARR